MKMNIAFRWLAAGLVAAAIGLTSQAQEENTAGQNPPAGRRPIPGGGRIMDGGGPVLSVLTDEQRASMEQALQAQREKMRELNLKLRDARREMLLAGLDGKFDEAAVRKQAMAVAKLEAELAVLRAKALSQIQPPLTPGQIEKIRNAAPAGPGARAAERPAARRRMPSDPNRDANDLPPKP